MRLLFLTHYFPPEGNAPASRVHGLARRWVAAGHRVTVITCVPNVPRGVPYPGYRNRWVQEEQLDGIRVVRVWTLLAANRGILLRSLNYLSYLLSATWRALRLGERPDVVLATSPQFFCGWAGVWTARLLRRPFVLEVRDLWPDSIDAVGAMGSGGRGRLRGAALAAVGWLERRMYRAARCIVTVGDGYRERLLGRGVAASKLEVVTNGVEGRLFVPREPDAERRRRVGAGPDEFVVGYIGTLGMAHGLEVVLEAGRLARRRGLDALRFVLVGDGARREALVAELAREDPGNVTLLERVPKDEVPAWIASLDACLVHLRAAEVFGTVLPSKLFEALAMQRPVLMGVRGHAREVLEATGGGLAFEPEDAAGLVEAAEALRGRPDRGAALGERGRAGVLADYDLDTLAQRYLAVLARLVRPAS